MKLSLCDSPDGWSFMSEMPSDVSPALITLLMSMVPSFDVGRVRFEPSPGGPGETPSPVPVQSLYTLSDSSPDPVDRQIRAPSLWTVRSKDHPIREGVHPAHHAAKRASKLVIVADYLYASNLVQLE